MEEGGAQKVCKQMASNVSKDISLYSHVPFNAGARSEEYIIRLLRCANVTGACTTLDGRAWARGTASHPAGEEVVLPLPLWAPG